MFNGSFVNSLQADNNRQVHYNNSLNDNSPPQGPAGSAEGVYNLLLRYGIYNIRSVSTCRIIETRLRLVLKREFACASLAGVDDLLAQTCIDRLILAKAITYRTTGIVFGNHNLQYVFYRHICI